MSVVEAWAKIERWIAQPALVKDHLSERAAGASADPTGRLMHHHRLARDYKGTRTAPKP
ncbi:hypothetical protein [Streptomyces sp. RK9]|uniref:hypothetical protein n=1 Tax=Streptomyces sp. RK9 TaxID=3239284 RepID=UPI00386785D7